MSPPGRSLEALAATRDAASHLDARRWSEALPWCEEAVRLDPGWWAAWSNLAVTYKHAGRWRECLEACERVLALSVADPDGDPDGAGDLAGAHWNAGIAATALGDWQRARVAWRAVGIPVPDGDGPIDFPCGTCCVRVSHDSGSEVLWCRRLDPCRAAIASIPLPSSGRSHGDVVLHDGEPRGRRDAGGASVAVFDELVLLAPSERATWEATLDVLAPADLDALTALAAEDLAIEDWTDGLTSLCAACSEGTPHSHHDRPAARFQRERRVALACRRDADLAPLHAWAAAGRGRRIRRLQRLR
jgi:tetratricopeptide (TPR) repeat protein